MNRNLALMIFALLSGNAYAQQEGGYFVPLAPCRVVDTRLPAAISGLGSPILGAGETRRIPMASSACVPPGSILAYSINITVVPPGPLPFLTVGPAGQTSFEFSTLNSFASKVVSNAALVPAGAGGEIDVFASAATHVIIDINGYFRQPTTSFAMDCGAPGRPAIQIGGRSVTPCAMIIGRTSGPGYVPIAGCRVLDTRPAGTFIGEIQPQISGARCGIPASASAYSLNVTAIPQGPLSYMTLFPAGTNRPLASTLNSFDGRVVASAAVVPAGNNGRVSVFATDLTDVVVDVNGYFTGDSIGVDQYRFFPIRPCRFLDTRSAGRLIRRSFPNIFPMVNAVLSGCVLPVGAKAASLNVTAIPVNGQLSYLSLGASGLPFPTTSTLNSFDGSIVANAAIVALGELAYLQVVTSDDTHLVIDINGYFQ